MSAFSYVGQPTDGCAVYFGANHYYIYDFEAVGKPLSFSISTNQPGGQPAASKNVKLGIIEAVANCFP